MQRTPALVVILLQTLFLLQAISKKGFWFKIEAEAKFKPEAYSSIPRI